MRNPIKTQTIPDLTPGIDDDVRRVLEAIKDIIEVREGVRGPDRLDQAVTFRDLVALGLISESQAK